MYTQTFENNPMKDKTQTVSNIAIGTLSAFLVIAGIILSVSLSVILFPFVLLNLYLIKRRFNHMMQSENESELSSKSEQGDIIEGEYIVSEETVSEKKDP